MTPKQIEQQKTNGEARDPKWEKESKAFLVGKVCAACGTDKHLQVHHKKPFHLFRSLELVKSNWIVLCETPGKNCHLNDGHLGDWKIYNPLVVQTAKFMLKLHGIAVKMKAQLEKGKK